MSRIYNTKTGQTLDVPDDQLGNYGLTPQSPIYNPQQQTQQPVAQQPVAQPTSQNPSLGGFFSNLASDVGSNVQGLLSIPGLIGQAVSDPARGGEIAKGMVTGTIDEYKRLLTGEGEGGTPLLSHAYTHPLNTVLDVLPILQAAKGISAASKAGTAAETLGKAGQTAETLGKAGDIATDVSKYAGKSLAEIGASQTPEEIAGMFGTDVNTLARRVGAVPETGAIATEKTLSDVANTLGTKESTLRESLVEALRKEGKLVRGAAVLPGGDRGIIDRLSGLSADSNPIINDIKSSLKRAHMEGAVLPSDFGTQLSGIAESGTKTGPMGQLAQEWASRVKPPLPPVEEAASQIAQRSLQKGAVVKAPSIPAKMLANLFNLPETVARRLTANEVSQDLIRYGVKDVNTAAVKSEQALNLLGGIYNDVVKRAGSVPDMGSYNVASEAFTSVGGGAAKRELGNASRIIYGVEKPTMNTAVATDELKAVRLLDAEEAKWRLRADSPTNPDPLAGRIADAYATTSDDLLNKISDKVRSSGGIEAYKTPEVIDAANKISPRLATQLQTASADELRGLMKTWVRAKQMVNYSGSGKLLGASKTGRYSLPMMAGIGLGAKFGVPGAVAGFLGGTLFQPAAEAFTQRALNVMTPTTITAIEAAQKPLSIAGNVAMNVLKTPIPVIAGKVASQGGTAAGPTTDTATQNLAMQVGYTPQEAAGPEMTYPLKNMISDVSRDPKNASYYKWLYDTLYKENLPTSAKQSQAREVGMINQVKTMLPLLDKATSLGPITGPMQELLQKTGAGYDPNTLLLFQRLALLKNAVASELSKRGASATILKTIDSAFPQINEPANVWRDKLNGLSATLQDYFQMIPPPGAATDTGTAGLGDISSQQIGQ